MLLSPNDRMCPIGLAADLIGDKWSIIILRDIALFNRQTYNVLLRKNLEGISSSTLAKKLNRLLDIKLLNVRKDKSHSQKKYIALQKQLLPSCQSYLIWHIGQMNMINQANYLLSR